MKAQPMHLTLASTDEEHYNRINITIPPVQNATKVRMTVTNLTANCYLQVLSDKDYLVLRQNNVTKTIQFNDYCSLTADSMCTLLNNKFTQAGFTIEVGTDHCSRLQFASSSGPFSIISVSYNVSLLLGLYAKKNEDYPILSEDIGTAETGSIHMISMKSVGYWLSTPVLYLVSNLGAYAIRNESNDNRNLQSATVAMRINNSFTEAMPIIASNCEFSQIVGANAVTGCYFTLVDANMVDVKLLTPMYICIEIEPQPIEE